MGIFSCAGGKILGVWGEVEHTDAGREQVLMRMLIVWLIAKRNTVSEPFILVAEPGMSRHHQTSPELPTWQRFQQHTAVVSHTWITESVLPDAVASNAATPDVVRQFSSSVEVIEHGPLLNNRGSSADLVVAVLCGMLACSLQSHEREGVGQLRKAVGVDESFRQHLLDDHVPWRHDCATCMAGGLKSRPHRHVKCPQAFPLSADLVGEYSPGKDEYYHRATWALVATFTVPADVPLEQDEPSEPTQKRQDSGDHRDPMGLSG